MGIHLHNTIRYVVCLFIGFGVMASCSEQDDAAPPTVDVTGIWHGTWTGETGGENGYQVMELVQDGGEVRGGIFLRESLPSLNNVGVEISGTVSGNTLRFTLDSLDYDHSFVGDIVNDSGEGTISYFSQKGTWQATRLETLSMRIVDSFEVPVHSIRNLVFDGTDLWCSDAGSIYRFSTDGDLLETIEPPSSCYGMTFDGTNLLCSEGSPDIVKINLEGEEIERFQVGELWPEQLAYDGENLWMHQSATYSLHVVDSAGNELHSFEILTYGDDMTFAGEYLWQLQGFPHIVLSHNSAGEIVAAYGLPPEVSQLVDGVRAIPSGIASDGSRFWIGVSQIDINGTGPGFVSIYTLEID